MCRLNEKEKASPRRALDSDPTPLSKAKFPPPILRKPLKPSKKATPESSHPGVSEDVAKQEKTNGTGGQPLAVLTDVVTSSEVGDALTAIISTATEEMLASQEMEKTVGEDGSVGIGGPVVTATADSGSDVESGGTTTTAGTPTVELEVASTADTAATDNKSSNGNSSTTATPIAEDASAVALPTSTDAPPTSTVAPPTSTMAPPTSVVALYISTVALPVSSVAPPISTVSDPTIAAPTSTVAPPISPAAASPTSTSGSLDTVAPSGANTFLSISNDNPLMSTPIVSKASSGSIDHSESTEEGMVLANLFRELSQSEKLQNGRSEVKCVGNVLGSAGSSAVDVLYSDDSNGTSSKSELAGVQSMADSNLSKEEEEEEVAAELVTDVLEKVVKPEPNSAMGNHPGATPTTSAPSTKFFPLPDSPPPPIHPRAPIPKKVYALRRKGPKSAYKNDAADKVEVVAKILSVSALVAEVVRKLKEESGSFSRQGSVSTPLTEASQGDGEAYMTAMRPLQFGERGGRCGESVEEEVWSWSRVIERRCGHGVLGIGGKRVVY